MTPADDTHQRDIGRRRLFDLLRRANLRLIAREGLGTPGTSALIGDHFHPMHSRPATPTLTARLNTAALAEPCRAPLDAPQPMDLPENRAT